MTGHHGGTGVAALQRRLARVEQQPALDLLGVGAVAGITLVGEHGPDLVLEEWIWSGVRSDAACDRARRRRTSRRRAR